MKHLLLKTILIFAAVGYATVVALYFIPFNWHIATVTVSSFVAVAFVLAPVNAAVWGSVGLILAMIIAGIRQEFEIWRPKLVEGHDSQSHPG